MSLHRYRRTPKERIWTTTVGDIIGRVPDDGLGVLNTPSYLAQNGRGCGHRQRHLTR
ncbi:MAG: hypothetical protein ACREOA_03580 [Candidatus Dormibacteria bacterium]